MKNAAYYFVVCLFLLGTVTFHRTAKAQSSSSQKEFYKFLSENLENILPPSFEPGKSNIVLIANDWAMKAHSASDKYSKVVSLLVKVGSTRKADKLNEYLKVSKEFAEKESNFFWAQYAYTMNLNKLNKFPDLTNQWEKLMKTECEDEYACLLKAVVDENMGSKQRNYEKAIRINPKYVKAYYEFGFFYEEQKKDKQNAIKYYQKAIEIGKDAKAYNRLGSLYLMEENYAKALEIFEKGIKENPKSSELHKLYNNQATAYYYLGKTEQAITTLKKALEVNPDYLNANYALGAIYLQNGNKEEGCKYLKKAEELGFDVPSDFMKHCR